MDPLPQTRLKSFFHHSISIKNSRTYQDFLQRKPKHSLNFKFSMLKTPQNYLPADERAVQLKLLKALRIVKPVTKVDLGQFEVTEDYSWKTILTKISRVKTLSIIRPQNNFKEKSLKYFARLQHLAYQLGGYFYPVQINNISQDISPINPLEYLKYCPKVCSLRVLDYSDEGELTKTDINLRHSLKSLESVTFIPNQCNEGTTYISLRELLKNLKSVSLCFYSLGSQEQITQTLNNLSVFSHLEEIGLRMRMDVDSGFIEACKRIAQRQILKKLTIDSDCEIHSNLVKILGAFQNCKLISFSLKTFIENSQSLRSIAEFIQNMDQLESLELQITKRKLFSKDDNFVEICKQINKLQALRSLKLNFYTKSQVFEPTRRILNFIPYLCDLFTKSTKIETLRLECNQLDPSEAFQSLLPVLGNAAPFLKNLSINLEPLPYTEEAYRSVLKLMRNLSKIQILEIYFLEFNSSNREFLGDVIEIVYAFKYLREFAIGDLKDTMTQLTVCQVVETISSKRGLRRFACGTNYDTPLAGRKEAEMINMSRIIEKIPILNVLTLVIISITWVIFFSFLSGIDRIYR